MQINKHIRKGVNSFSQHCNCIVGHLKPETRRMSQLRTNLTVGSECPFLFKSAQRWRDLSCPRSIRSGGSLQGGSLCCVYLFLYCIQIARCLDLCLSDQMKVSESSLLNCSVLVKPMWPFDLEICEDVPRGEVTSGPLEGHYYSGICQNAGLF